MTGPTPEQIDVAIQALRDDAQRWQAAAGDLEIAARVAGELDLQAFHFSYVADRVGVTGTYRQLQDKLIDLLDDGAANSRRIAQALHTAANGYQEADRNAEYRLNKSR